MDVAILAVQRGFATVCKLFIGEDYR
jgi:hypothetical protein